MFWLLSLGCLAIELINDVQENCDATKITNGTFQGCEFSNERGWVGGTNVKTGELVIIGCQFLRCKVSTLSRGGVCRVSGGGGVSVSFSLFSECQGLGPSCMSIELDAEISYSNFTRNYESFTGGDNGMTYTYMAEWNGGYGCVQFLNQSSSSTRTITVNLTKCIFQDNANGGVTTAKIRIGTITIDSCEFENNTALDNNSVPLDMGGDLIIDGGIIEMKGCTFHSDSDAEGRSIYCAGSRFLYNEAQGRWRDHILDITLTDCTFVSTATKGSTIYFDINCTKSTFTMKECQFCGECVHMNASPDSLQAIINCVTVQFSAKEDLAVKNAVEVKGENIVYGMSCDRDLRDEQGQKPPPPPKSGLTGGEIAGIVIGVLVVLAIIIVILVVVIRKRQYQKSHTESEGEPSEVTSVQGTEIVARNYGKDAGVWEEENAPADTDNA